MIIILDNIFPQHVVDLIKNSLINLPITDTWYEKEDNFFIDDIIKISSKYFNLSEMIGYEMHKNITGPGFHQDKDEVLFSLKRKRYNGQQDKILLIAKNLMLQKIKKPIVLQLSALLIC